MTPPPLFFYMPPPGIFHVTLSNPINPVSGPRPPPRERSIIGRFRIAFTVNVYFYHVAMLSRSLIDPPVETQNLFAAWIMIYIIIHARCISWMLAGFIMA